MEIKFPSCTPEIWGGVECTINRVGTAYRDQLEESGHYLRESDIDAFATLGTSKMRYPVLWEKHAPLENKKIDWGYTSLRLNALRNNNITPIAGLLHHGSGPLHTNLLDEDFPNKLAAYAREVANQFPWLEYYTPVNEPLTTARFSGLYGFWYPHHSNDRSFIQMVLNQVKGIVLAMKAIREINPAAQLVQTEDLSKTHSTPELHYQASFENERRWLTSDLLCGKFKPGHPLWNYVRSLGIPEATLQFFVENTCPPQIMGFNYYVTSERYLDQRIENYPPHLHGGNGNQHYVDIDAGRVYKRDGLATLLGEAWIRYHVPLAVTECHLNCGREDQMRWLKETWDACIAVNSRGIPVVAMTAWSLLGSFDWDSLLLHQQGHYESGIFDLSNGDARATILAKMVKAYAMGTSFDHPLLASNGWWHQQPKHLAPNVAEATPLLILYPSASSAGPWENICLGRRIHHHVKYIGPSEAPGFAPGDLYESSIEPWGIIISLTDYEDEELSFYEDIVVHCIENGIALMFYMSFEKAEVMRQMNVNYINCCLAIHTDSMANIQYMQQALDLFIDEEKGWWTLLENGAQKMEPKERAVIYQ